MIYFDVKRRQPKPFLQLINGRSFLWNDDPKKRSIVWFKKNRTLAQDITDENMYRNFSPHDLITEVSLIQHEVAEQVNEEETPDT